MAQIHHKLKPTIPIGATIAPPSPTRPKNEIAWVEIPTMTHPLSAYWDQPAREQILVDQTAAVMNRKTFDALAEYSTSLPTGVYEGKMWKRDQPSRMMTDGEIVHNWFLVWYDKSPDPEKCMIKQAIIFIID